MSQEVFASGTVFISEAFSKTLEFGETVRIEEDFSLLIDKAKGILQKVGWIDIPLIMEKLDINSQTAVKIIKKLRKSGNIVPKDEIL